MSNLINDISTFISTHESTMVVLSAWLSKEWHVAWPAIKSSFPYVRDNGGLWGLFLEFVVGKKNATNVVVPLTQPVTPVVQTQNKLV